MNEKKLENLLNKAKSIQKNAYVPYSQFRVAVIVGLKDEQQVFGVNVENASFPATICAERVALSQLITLGYKKEDIEFLFLITDSNTLGSPCGICRQFMVEIMPLDTKIYISNHKTNNIKETEVVLVKDLLPIAFLSTSLERKK